MQNLLSIPMLLTGGDIFRNGYEEVTEILTFQKLKLKKWFTNCVLLNLNVMSLIS